MAASSGLSDSASAARKNRRRSIFLSATVGCPAIGGLKMSRIISANFLAMDTRL